MDPRYEGPYTVVRETKGGSYVLRDEQGLLASRNFAPSQLKLVSQDELVDTNELYEKGGKHYTIQAIVDHKGLTPGQYKYTARWEGYSEADDTWEPPEPFRSPDPIAKYWNRISTTPTTRSATHATSSGTRNTTHRTNTTQRSNKTTPKRPAPQTRTPPTRQSKRTRRNVNYTV